MTRIYNEKLKEVKKSKYSNYETLKFLSLRNKTEDQIRTDWGGTGGYGQGLRDDGSQAQAEQAQEKEEEVSKGKAEFAGRWRHLFGEGEGENQEDCEYLTSLADTTKSGFSWGGVSHYPCLLDIWDDFYEIGEVWERCLWDPVGPRTTLKRLGIGTLYMWAYEDNLKAQEDSKHDVEKLMYGSLSSWQLMPRLSWRWTRATFKYGTNNWYQFKNHKWNAVKDGIEPKKKISKPRA